MDIGSLDNDGLEETDVEVVENIVVEVGENFDENWVVDENLEVDEETDFVEDFDENLDVEVVAVGEETDFVEHFEVDVEVDENFDGVNLLDEYLVGDDFEIGWTEKFGGKAEQD